MKRMFLLAVMLALLAGVTGAYAWDTQATDDQMNYQSPHGQSLPTQSYPDALDAQHDAAQAYIRSQAHAGWTLIRSRYADGGYSAARPTGRRCSDCWQTSGRARSMSSWSTSLTRSLADFAKLVELFDEHAVSFPSSSIPRLRWDA